MITKELFIKFISNFKKFDDAIDRINDALVGDVRGYVCLQDSDWYGGVGYMFDAFTESHFTTEGVDLINWWYWEDVEKVLYEIEGDVEYEVETLDQLWDYMVKFKEDYFLNV